MRGWLTFQAWVFVKDRGAAECHQVGYVMNQGEFDSTVLFDRHVSEVSSDVPTEIGQLILGLHSDGHPYRRDAVGNASLYGRYCMLPTPFLRKGF